jgi:hypothetical protein
MAEKYIARSKAIAARMLGGEMMVMSATDSTFYTLNEVATAIWQAADGRTPLAQIVRERICREFEIDEGTANCDADQFVDDLSRHGILVVSSQPLADTGSNPSEAR